MFMSTAIMIQAVQLMKRQFSDCFQCVIFTKMRRCALHMSLWNHGTDPFRVLRTHVWTSITSITTKPTMAFNLAEKTIPLESILNHKCTRNHCNGVRLQRSLCYRRAS